MSTGSLPPIALFLRDFYKKSDDPEDHEGYADFFTEDATVIIGLKTFKGWEGIILFVPQNASKAKKYWVFAMQLGVM